MKTAITALAADKVTPAESAVSLAKKKAPPTSATGFLLMDPSLNVQWFNAEAVRILSYPEGLKNAGPADSVLRDRILSKLITQPTPGESVFVTEFFSGKRRYFCRVFVIDPHAQEVSKPTIAVLLERGPSGFFQLERISERFNLTGRERQVVEYLLQGMSSKEIAARMGVSPSTVKSFLRMIMVKTRVSSRSAILGKILMT